MTKPRIPLWPGRACVICGWFALAGCAALPGASAEPPPDTWIADTDPGTVLQTLEVVLPAAVRQPFPDRLSFEMGFSTLELPELGVLYDSITLSLSLPDGSDPVIVATGDVFGLTLPAEGIGGLIPGGSVQTIETGFQFEPLPGAGITYAYTVNVTLPESAQGLDYRGTFDLFSNGNPLSSRAYVIVVPEPGVLALGGVGAACLAAALWRRRRVR